MIRFSARELGFIELNHRIHAESGDVLIEDCYGERFIGIGSSGKTITINGTPGNALGSYLDGATIIVRGNAQDAVGDTMNDGAIYVHGNAGDTLGYAMRGGKIFVRGNSGYRTGIHMKEYKEKKPLVIIGGTTGGFLGEYLAGGRIIVLGLGTDQFPAGEFIATGMHGGEIFIRTNQKPQNISKHVIVSEATQEDLAQIEGALREFSAVYDIPMEQIMGKKFLRLRPDSKNPYGQLYVEN